MEKSKIEIEGIQKENISKLATHMPNLGNRKLKIPEDEKIKGV